MSGLPEGWAWAELSEVADACLGKMLDKVKRTRGTPIAYLRNQNVRWYEFDLTELYEMPFEEHELERYAVEPGDVLICEGGEPGRAAIWNGPANTVKFQKALHRVRVGSLLDSKYLVHRLKFDAETGGLTKYLTGTTIKHFPGTSLARYRLPLPPLAEQRRIVARLDELLARSRAARERLERLVGSPPLQGTRLPSLLTTLDQSLLAKAFRGELVPQDPNDEPASVLLERIRAERAAAEAPARGRRRRVANR